MPYKIKKQKCTQSDGDKGSYVLSYTSKKGKKYNNCHTSKKKARGQIAAIEGPRENKMDTTLRSLIREILSEDEMSDTKTATKIKDTGELEISDRGDFYVIKPKRSVLPGAIMVYHPKTKTLFSGSLVFEGLIPSIKNADLSAWRTTLEDLKTLDISTIIPTMGEVTSVLAIEASLNYLRDLENRTTQLYRDNTDLLSATELGHIEDYAKWKMYNDRHFNNVMYQYLYLENKDLK